VYRAVTTFTNVQISAFFSSIVKNRLYCDAPDSLSRRSAQTVLFEVSFLIVFVALYIFMLVYCQLLIVLFMS
jgi:isoleucyl-tRNA synthetase